MRRLAVGARCVIVLGCWDGPGRNLQGKQVVAVGQLAVVHPHLYGESKGAVAVGREWRGRHGGESSSRPSCWGRRQDGSLLTPSIGGKQHGTAATTGHRQLIRQVDGQQVGSWPAAAIHGPLTWSLLMGERVASTTPCVAVTAGPPSTCATP